MRKILKNKKEWHSWFAWHPVIVESHNLKILVWWEYVERINAPLMLDGPFFNYIYRFPELPVIPNHFE